MYTLRPDIILLLPSSYETYRCIVSIISISIEEYFCTFCVLRPNQKILFPHISRYIHLHNDCTIKEF